MSTKKTMKLMSWNVAGRTDKTKLYGQLSKIENEDIDILALQEVKPKAAVDFTEELPKIGLEHVELAPVIQRKHSVLLACRWPMKPIQMIKAPWKESVLSAIIRSPHGEIETHVIHAPNGSNNRRQKIDTFNAIYDALTKKSDYHCILCGDFNSPKEEFSDGRIITFDEKNEKFDGSKGRDCERKVICGLADYDLEDTYLKLHGCRTRDYSWVQSRKGKETKRRLDHIFSSKSLNPIKCGYRHGFRESGLSDHSPVYAEYEPKFLRLLIKKKSSRSD